ncbi:hypothetical protein N781_06170 [Pontibacillus halophilus JSM 076056 = DSM 19796]|uniref:Uncharacterized protein n=1 Tax=Pontibacillus halophilus JSM 076056 = DSM 19796 TaxID=1385510 RepID=A0A0A5GIC5_9BACI|nr:hypothetical protein [Pontibacillus halophilus]KGX90963.1 hypothetical protein N781_06170 [Pontibacillus halophilus JSM 076056 = DSM 19796]
MKGYEGELVSGSFMEDEASFYLTSLRHLETASTLGRDQLLQLYRYLHHQQEQGESCLVTINDQMPLLFQEDEVAMLMNDLREIMNEVGLHE